MKYLIALFIVSSIFFPLSIADLSSQDILIDIQKSKRPFIKIHDRKYLKRKNVKNRNVVPASITQSYADSLLKIAEQKEDSGNFKGAMNDVNSLLIVNPGNPEGLYFSGNLKFKMEEFTNAVTDYTKAIETDTASVELYFSRGNSFFEIRDYDSAIGDFSKAIAIDSTDELSFYNRAICYLWKEDNTAACKNFGIAATLGFKLPEEVPGKLCKSIFKTGK